MLIGKFAERVENYIEKHFRRSPRMNFIYLFITSIVELVLMGHLINASFSDMIIVRIASLLLFADALTKNYFAIWIFFTGKAKESEKWLKLVHCFMLFIEIFYFCTFCAAIPLFLK